MGQQNHRELMRHGRLPVAPQALFATALLVTGMIVPCSCAEGAESGLVLRVFNNTALAGTPLTSTIIRTPAFTFDQDDGPFSASMSGSFSVARGYLYGFNCSFGAAVLGYLHIDGHLVCATGTNGRHPPAGRDVRSTTFDDPLPVLSSLSWPFRLVVVHNGSGSAGEVGVNVSRTIDRSAVSAAPAHTSHTRLVDTSTRAQGSGAEGAESRGTGRLGARPDDDEEENAGWLERALSPALPEAERRRDDLQAELAKGWAAWYDHACMHMHALHARTPTG